MISFQSRGGRPGLPPEGAARGPAAEAGQEDEELLSGRPEDAQSSGRDSEIQNYVELNTPSMVYKGHLKF